MTDEGTKDSEDRYRVSVLQAMGVLDCSVEHPVSRSSASSGLIVKPFFMAALCFSGDDQTLFGLVRLNLMTPSCLRRGTGVDRDPRRWGKRETIPIATFLHSHRRFIWSLRRGTGRDRDPR